MSGQDSASLLSAARAYVKQHYVQNQHHASCMLVAGAKTYPASHLDTVGGLDICAEPIALSNAIADGQTEFTKLVTVMWNGNEQTEPWIITPCGNCRQILVEYAPDLNVLVQGETDIEELSAADLLPRPYVKRAQ